MDPTLAEVIDLFNDGSLTLLHRPQWLDPACLTWLHLANAGDATAAIALADTITAEWVWHLGYDNRATMTSRDDPERVITVISLSPAHALGLATLQAMAASA